MAEGVGGGRDLALAWGGHLLLGRYRWAVFWFVLPTSGALLATFGAASQGPVVVLLSLVLSLVLGIAAMVDAARATPAVRLPSWGEERRV